MATPPQVAAGAVEQQMEPAERFIRSQAPRIRCVAGPGTGKTFGLQRRVERLLLNGIIGARIFAVTFTRQAAAQLRNDLTGLGAPGAETIVASTLHAYAFKILSSEGAIQALGRWPRPCFEHEITPFLHDMAEAHGGVKRAGEKLHAFDAMWARLQSDQPGWPLDASDRAFHEAYLSWMRFHRAISLGELIPLAVQYLRQNPQNDVVTAFDHVLVDEYQDLNRADQALIEHIGALAHIAIVGDDDQSIYSFRHAHPEGIREWITIQPDPKDDVELARCRRCDGKILSIANQLIRQNPGRIRGDLLPEQGRENAGDVKIIQWQTREQESRGIAQGIRHLLQNDRVPPEGKILVLVPRHDFGRAIIDALVDGGVTDTKLHSKGDWREASVGESIALIRLLGDESDMVALRYWLGHGHNQWRRNEYARLRQECETRGVEPSAVLQDDARCSTLRIRPLRARWMELQTRLQALRTLNEEQILEQLLPATGATLAIGRSVRALRESGADGTLAELLVTAAVAPDDQPMEAKVNVMTYHGAKGLSAHTVIATGLVNGIMPRTPAPRTPAEQQELQEQRRLFFVALTRARHRLVMSSFRSVTRGENANLRLGLTGGGFRLTTHASRFLGEMGPLTPITQTGDAWLTAFEH